jgi:hypothetical protein
VTVATPRDNSTLARLDYGVSIRVDSVPGVQFMERMLMEFIDSTNSTDFGIRTVW